MRGLRGFFKALNQGRKSKQVVLATLLLFLTISMALALPSTNTKKTTAINTSPTFIQTTSKANDTTYWNKTYGGNQGDHGYCVKQTTDGGYIVVGSTYSFGDGSEDIWLVKTNSSGYMEWSKTYGKVWDDYGSCVVQTSDGGYIIIGYTGGDIWLIKTDSSGNEEWNKTYGIIAYDERGHCCLQTSDGGYILVGSKRSFSAGGSDIWLIRTDENGDHQWNKTYGGTDYDSGICIVQTSNGGYIIVGSTRSFGIDGSSDVWLIKTDTSGNISWNRTYGGTDDDYGYSVVRTSDGGYMVAGATESYGAGSYDDVLLIKTNSSGHLEWNKTFGGTDFDVGSCVVQASDGGYIVVGHTRSFGDIHGDVWLIKTNENGNHQWNKTFGGTDYDHAYWVEQTTDGGYIITGETWSYGAGASDVWLIKTDADGFTEVPEEPNSPPVNHRPRDQPPYVPAIYIALFGVIFTVLLVRAAISAPSIRESFRSFTSRGLKKWKTDKLVYALPCPNCGAMVKMGATSCKNCQTEFQECVVCKLAILDDLMKTPCCEYSAHRSHLREWLKIKGKCPNCGEKLEEWELSETEN